MDLILVDGTLINFDHVVTITPHYATNGQTVGGAEIVDRSSILGVRFHLTNGQQVYVSGKHNWDRLKQRVKGRYLKTAEGMPSIPEA